MDYGIDVSGYNAITNWPAVRAVGNSWAWAKATQGDGYTSPLFAAQIAGARAAGLLPGAYHFPDPNVSVAANVGHFVAVANAAYALDAGCFLPLLDMEDDPADGIVWTAASANAFVPAFRDEFRRQTGVHQLCVYGSESWFATGKLNPAQWVDDGVFLAVAQYSGVPGQVSWTHPRAAVHQYTDNAPTPGATKPTDRSCTLGSWSARQLTIGGSVRPAAPTEEDDMGHGFVIIKRITDGAFGVRWDSGQFDDERSYDPSIVELGAANGVPIIPTTDAGWSRLITIGQTWQAGFTAAAEPKPTQLGDITLALPNGLTVTNEGGGVTTIKADATS